MLPRNALKKIKKDIDRSPANEYAFLFKALGDQHRIKILVLLFRHKDICVTDIAAILGVTIPAASQQLKIIERARLITRTKTGQTVCYEINGSHPFIRHVRRFILKK